LSDTTNEAFTASAVARIGSSSGSYSPWVYVQIVRFSPLYNGAFKVGLHALGLEAGQHCSFSPLYNGAFKVGYDQDSLAYELYD